MNNQAIGIFDSGVGGLSVWQELIKLMPSESMYYYADSANCPYGEKSPSEIVDLSSRIVDFLLEKDCKLVVVACNTATSAAISELRRRYNLPIIGIEPAIKPAALLTQTGKVGVIATQGTLKGEKFKNTRNRYAQNVEVWVQIGYGLVELVEAGKADSPQAYDLLSQYLNPMLAQGVDQIVLGCTHYPFLIPTIEQIIGKQAQVINPAIAVARHTLLVLQHHALKSDSRQVPDYQFFSSKDELELQAFVATIAPQFAKQKFVKMPL
ncbi:MAG: glutamate racemase [Microscillaceae bacterium]|jgi:glutamate racemase|nr:glutamate racemase [Microscillaceae bacterium]